MYTPHSKEVLIGQIAYFEKELAKLEREMEATGAKETTPEWDAIAQEVMTLELQLDALLLLESA